MMVSELTESVVATIQSAARKLTGFLRRQFQAEMALKYCEGRARRAEDVFGWGRAAVEMGLNELRTGLRCYENFSSRGRRQSEEQAPELASAIHALVEPTSQADPKFQTPLAYTRITAKAVREQLAAQGDCPVPAERTLHDILNRLGYSLRRVRKTRPQKNFPKRTSSSPTSAASTPGPPATRKRSASRSTRRPK
jgi:transposase